MDPSLLRVKISGPLLSKLLHERYRNSGNCGGLLYGEIVTATKHEITDSQNVMKSEDFICIQDYLPMTSRDFLCNQKQSSQSQAWGESRQFPSTSCIGMYKIRNSAANLSLLEKSLYRKLCKELYRENATKISESVVALLITTESNFNATCLNWKINAFVQDNLQFSNVKLEVSNLQGSVCDLYVTNPNPIGTMSSRKTDAVLQSFQSSLTENSGGVKVVEASRKVTQDLISELDDIFGRLEVSENTFKSLLKEKATLLKEWNALSAKKESKRLEDSEREYQAEKRRSLEDIRRRSPVVLLEKLDMSNAKLSSDPDNDSDTPTANGTCSMRSSTSIFNSVKASPKRDIVEDMTSTLNYETGPALPDK